MCANCIILSEIVISYVIFLQTFATAELTRLTLLEFLESIYRNIKMFLNKINFHIYYLNLI